MGGRLELYCAGGIERAEWAPWGRRLPSEGSGQVSPLGPAARLGRCTWSEARVVVAPRAVRPELCWLGRSRSRWQRAFGQKCPRASRAAAPSGEWAPWRARGWPCRPQLQRPEHRPARWRWPLRPPVVRATTSVLTKWAASVCCCAHSGPAGRTRSCHVGSLRVGVALRARNDVLM